MSSSYTAGVEPPLLDGENYTVVQVGEKPREWKPNTSGAYSNKGASQNMSKSQANEST